MEIYHKKQYGFRKDYGTIIAIIDFLTSYTKIQKSNPQKEIWVATIDIAKCYDSISHVLIRKSIKRFITDPNIKNFLLSYYTKKGLGLYQGDPLSPIIFAYVSHFLIKKIKKIVSRVQMYADDLILIILGKDTEVEIKLAEIYKIIRNFGMKPNKKKCKKTKKLEEIKYLGVWLDSGIHLMKNKEKAESSFKKLGYLMKSSNISNGLRIVLFKSIILSQLLYGFEIFQYQKKQIQLLNVYINSCLTTIFRINRHTPVGIYRIESKIPDIQIIINRRKYNLKMKLYILT